MWFSIIGIIIQAVTFFYKVKTHKTFTYFYIKILTYKKMPIEETKEKKVKSVKQDIM